MKNNQPLKFTFLIAFTLLCSQVTRAQSDSLSDFLFRLKTEFRQIYLGPTSPKSRVKLIPTAHRDPNYQISDVTKAHVTDNPLLHSACYAMFEADMSFRNHFFVSMKPVFEQRGMSYGILNTRAMATYLRATASYRDSFNILKDTLFFSVTVGDLPLKKLHQGLKIWNIDMQGTSGEIKFRNLSYRIHHLGDLMYWIGLNINDLHAHSFRWTIHPGKNWTFGIGPIFTLNVRPTYLQNSDTVAEYLIYEPGGELFLEYKNTRVFIESSFLFRKQPPSYWETYNRNTLLAGFETSFKHRRTTLTLSTRYRYYGYLYLALFYSTTPRFRDQDSLVRGINTIGGYLYPLENYFRPVSQFSVYTESQKYPYNLKGVEFESDYNYQFSNRFSNSLNIEAILLWRSKAYSESAPFLYFFYTNMLSYQPDPKLLISFVVTNKMMDLDASYHAHYMTVTPFLGFSVWKKM